MFGLNDQGSRKSYEIRSASNANLSSIQASHRFAGQRRERRTQRQLYLIIGGELVDGRPTAVISRFAEMPPETLDTPQFDADAAGAKHFMDAREPEFLHGFQSHFAAGFHQLLPVVGAAEE